MRCIAKDPNERYTTMDAVLQAIKQAHGVSMTGQLAAVNMSGAYMPVQTNPPPAVHSSASGTVGSPGASRPSPAARTRRWACSARTAPARAAWAARTPSRALIRDAIEGMDRRRRARRRRARWTARDGGVSHDRPEQLDDRVAAAGRRDGGRPPTRRAALRHERSPHRARAPRPVERRTERCGERRRAHRDDQGDDRAGRRERSRGHDRALRGDAVRRHVQGRRRGSRQGAQAACSRIRASAPRRGA